MGLLWGILLKWCSHYFYDQNTYIEPWYTIYLARRVWRCKRGNQNPYIEEEQTQQWPKEKVQKDKQRSTKDTSWIAIKALRCEAVTISVLKRRSVRLNLQLFIGGLVSCLRYLCLYAYSGVQHILCCVFPMFFFVLCTLCCQFLWIVHFW